MRTWETEKRTCMHGIKEELDWHECLECRLIAEGLGYEWIQYRQTYIFLEMPGELIENIKEDDLDVEIELEEEKWPKIIDTYVHGSKENGYDVGQELGLTGEALDQFVYLHYEVELTIKVEQDGNYVITHVDGQPVEEKEETGVDS
jgi:hypothetical protein